MSELCKHGKHVENPCVECDEERSERHSELSPARGSADGVISDEVESLLINVAQILDVVKTEWAQAWSPFDQEQRDHITKLLMAKRPPNSEVSECRPAD